MALGGHEYTLYTICIQRSLGIPSRIATARPFQFVNAIADSQFDGGRRGDLVGVLQPYSPSDQHSNQQVQVGAFS
jgi:hypothetical protein